MTDQIRFLLALDGAGAPLVTQCLGAMSGIAMLSRIHPAAENPNNPLEQAYKWFGLVDDSDLDRLRAQPDWPYHEIMQMIAERAEQKGQILIIGDRSNDDFVADKPVSELPGIFLHPTVLESRFTPKSVALVRHPVDQWIHQQNQLGPNAPRLEIFMRGYRRFSECLDGIGIVRFEDFLSDPASVLKAICNHLDAPYNADWETNWREYNSVISEPSVKRPEGAAEVAFTDEIIQAFIANADYAPTLEKLGYADAS
jgi:hypothetical protein